MNNKLTFTGGEPNMNEDDFLRIQKANLEFIQTFLADFGECIVSGCEAVVDGSYNIDLTSGFVFLDGEMLRVHVAGATAPTGGNTKWRYIKETTFEAGGDKTYLDGTARQTWEKNRAIPESVASIGAGDLDCENGKRYNKLNEWTYVDDTDLLNGWLNLFSGDDRFRYRMLKNGYIHIYGVLSGASATSGTAYTLPTGFLPLNNQDYPIAVEPSPSTQHRTGVLNIATGGALTFRDTQNADGSDGSYSSKYSINVIFPID